MKELAELKWVSVALFSACLVFVLTNILQLAIRGPSSENTDPDRSEYLWPHFGKLMITSMATISTAFNYNANLFPIYSGQIDKSVKGSLKSILTAMALISTIYITLALVTIFNFGSGIQDSLLKNLGDERSAEGDIYWENYLMQSLFLVILACHIPYIFFSGKESLLIIVDETMRKSISFTLSKKLV